MSKFKNTNRIRQAALTFLVKGYYTDALPGTKEYFDYWDSEKKKCLYGYQIDDLHITGIHYFYLNYCPIDRAVEETLPDGTIQSKRERSFPAFYDGDWQYYQEIDSRLKESFPHKYKKEETRMQETSPAQVVAGGTRSTPSSNKKVKLSKEDVRLANKWNIPLEQYAQEKLKANNAEGEYTTVNMQRGGKK